jgi:hypothetical protein
VLDTVNEPPKCVDCDQCAPETNTEHTLISAAFGWRLTRAVQADGRKVLEWHCPWCWRKRKEENAIKARR